MAPERVIGLALACAAGVLGCAGEDSARTADAPEAVPVISTSTAPPALILPAAMQETLRAFDPRFEVATADLWAGRRYRYAHYQAPFAVVAEMNGDERPDVVVMGSSGGVPRVLALVSREGGGHEVQAIPAPRGGEPQLGKDHLEFVLPSLTRSPYDSRTIRFHHEVVIYVTAAGGTDYLHLPPGENQLRFWSLGD